MGMPQLRKQLWRVRSLLTCYTHSSGARSCNASGSRRSPRCLTGGNRRETTIGSRGSAPTTRRESNPSFNSTRNRRKLPVRQLRRLHRQRQGQLPMPQQVRPQDPSRRRTPQLRLLEQLASGKRPTGNADSGQNGKAFRGSERGKRRST